jgi:sugar phosphate isomerase/epimerase
VSQLPPVLLATGPLYMYSLEETFEVISDAGFDGAELMVTQDRLTQDPHRLLALAGRYELAVPAIHGPFLLVTWRVFGTSPRAKIDRCVELASSVGASTVVIHPPYRFQTGYNDWLAGHIAEVKDETGITIAVENMFPVAVNGRRYTFYRGMDLADLARFPYLTLDLSHLAVTGLDVMDAWAQVAGQVAHVHVSNNAGAGRDSHAPLDQGVLPVPAFLEELGASGYAGSVTLELDVRPWVEDRAALLEVLQTNLGIARDHLATGARRAGTAARRSTGPANRVGASGRGPRR